MEWIQFSPSAYSVRDHIETPIEIFIRFFDENLFYLSINVSMIPA